MRIVRRSERLGRGRRLLGTTSVLLGARRQDVANARHVDPGNGAESADKIPPLLVRAPAGAREIGQGEQLAGAAGGAEIGRASCRERV